MSQKRGVAVFSLADTSKPISVFRDDQKVDLGDWGNISESEALVVFVDDSGRNLLLDDLVKNCDFFRLCSLGLCLLSLIYHLLFNY